MVNKYLPRNCRRRTAVGPVNAILVRQAIAGCFLPQNRQLYSVGDHQRRLRRPDYSEATELDEIRVVLFPPNLQIGSERLEVAGADGGQIGRDCR